MLPLIHASLSSIFRISSITHTCSIPDYLYRITGHSPSRVYLTRKFLKTLGLDGTTCSYNLNEEDEETERAALMTFDRTSSLEKGSECYTDEHKT
jgi:hypothetical protein